MAGSITDLLRHPIKGFTPERITAADLTPGAAFPCDRLYAVEDGPSGFDPSAPGFIPKQRFAVLAKIADVARVRTAYDPETGVLRASATGARTFRAPLTDEEGRAAFSSWLSDVLGEAARGPLRTIDGRGHRFLDHPLGHVSIINLASVRALADAIGQPVDPLRFRANIYVDGWPAWAENDWIGRDMSLGAARVRVFQPITRCAAPAVNPTSALRDIDITAALHRHFSHLLCGLYVHVVAAGRIALGDEAVLLAA